MVSIIVGRGGGESENIIDGPVSSVWLTLVSGIGDDENLFPDAARLNIGRVRDEVRSPEIPAAVRVSVDLPALLGRSAASSCSIVSSCAEP